MTRRLTTTQQGYGWAWQQLRLTILNRDGYTCADCGQHANTVDHITPKVEGGTDHPTNLQAMCRSCNSRRAGQWVRPHHGQHPGRPRGTGRTWPGALG